MYYNVYYTRGILFFIALSLLILFHSVMSSQITTPQDDSITQMISEPQIINDLPSPDNTFVYPPFVDTMQIDGVAKKIRKMYRATRREQNLCKNINNYDKYKERCIKCKLNPRPIDLLIAEQENLRERLLRISKDIDYINF